MRIQWLHAVQQKDVKAAALSLQRLRKEQAPQADLQDTVRVGCLAKLAIKPKIVVMIQIKLQLSLEAVKGPVIAENWIHFWCICDCVLTLLQKNLYSAGTS